MKIVIAPDSFKESLSALDVARAIERGLRRVLPDAEYVKIPMADGGEGTVRALVAATGGRFLRRRVSGPLGEPVRAEFGLLGAGEIAVIEMASASGLPLVPAAKRNPLKTSSYGTGQLIRHALGQKVRRLIVGIGGSATNDGGAGMAQALGIRFRDRRGRLLSEPLTGGSLAQIASIDMSAREPRLDDVELLVACDVTNPLTGPLGAAAVFGPQKGARPGQIRQLDDNLRALGGLIERQLGMKVVKRAGAGAAGGLGAGLVAFAGGRLARGIDLVIDAVGLAERMQGAALVITGEGRIDFQTAFGKAPAGVASVAGRLGIPVVGIGGSLSDDAAKTFLHGMSALEAAVTRPMPIEQALAEARKYLTNAGERVGRWVCLAHRLSDPI